MVTPAKQLVISATGPELAARHWSLARFGGWYDFATTVPHDPGLEIDLAGHLETGKDSISDPAMGGLI